MAMQSMKKCIRGLIVALVWLIFTMPRRLVRMLVAFVTGADSQSVQAYDLWCWRVSRILYPRFLVARKVPWGINCVGFFTGEFGLATCCRGIASAIKQASIPHVLSNLELRGMYANTDSTFTEFTRENPFRFNLLQCQPDFWDAYLWSLGTAHPEGRYTIGLWFWEMQEIPATWKAALPHYHEIWANTEFVCRAIRKAAAVPVVKIPFCVEIDTTRLNCTRSHYSLPDDHYLFLSYFDYGSAMERKNPMAVIQAFREMLISDEKIGLVIKTMHGEHFPQQVDELCAATVGLNVYLIDSVMSREELLSLANVCDCVVSLHRAEGLGLSMVEPMYLGKPVIATAYSGNMEFMNDRNSYLVKYRMVRTARDHGCIPAGSLWADADISHAAQLMRHVIANPEDAHAKGRQAMNDIRQRHNPVVVGKAIARRLRRISLWGK